MRLLGRIAGLLLLIALAVGAWWKIGGVDPFEFLRAQHNDIKLELAPQAVVSAGYRNVAADRWLTFALPAGTSQIKLVSTADVTDLERVRRQRTADPLKRWTYALEYEVVGNDGQRILHRVHHHRTDLSLFRLPDGREYTGNFYLTEARTPLIGIIVHINLAGLPAADSFRIRVARRDDDIANVLLRAYIPKKTAEEKVAYLWQRINEKQKEELARGSVYSHDLLYENEKRNLLLTTWQAIGPRGVRGRDFLADDFYVLRDNDGEAVDAPIAPAGVLIDPITFGTVPIPEKGGRIRLHLNPSATPGATRGELRLLWTGTSAFRRREWTLNWQAGDADPVFDLAGGLLEIRPPREMSVQAYVEDSGNSTEITPPPIYLRVFVADSRNPVEYAVEHADARPTPFRVGFRVLRDPAKGDAPPQARYELLDAARQPIGGGTIDLLNDAAPSPWTKPTGRPGWRAFSHYERMLDDFSGSRIVEVAEFHFALSTAVRAIRFYAAADPGQPEPLPLLVSAQTSAADVARRVRVPEDQYDFAALGERVPGWFMVRPADFEALMVDHRSRVLTLQAQPATDRPELLAGRFQWEDFRPAGNWLARSLLTPREEGVPDRPEALPSTFLPLVSGRETTIDFPSYLGVDRIAPSLAWINPGDAPLAATLHVDGRIHAQVQARGIFGETQLPPLPAGRHRLRLVSEGPARWLVNHAPATPKSLIKRLGIRLERTLHFSVERIQVDEEVLALRLFQPFSAKSPTTLRIRVSPVRPPENLPLPGWLFAERIAEVRPDPGFAAPIFDADGRRADAGQPIFIPFPHGWPRGRYDIEVSLAAGSGGWLTLSRLNTVLRRETRVLQEAGVADANSKPRP